MTNGQAVNRSRIRIRLQMAKNAEIDATTRPSARTDQPCASRGTLWSSHSSFSPAKAMAGSPRRNEKRAASSRWSPSGSSRSLRDLGGPSEFSRRLCLQLAGSSDDRLRDNVPNPQNVPNPSGSITPSAFILADRGDVKGRELSALSHQPASTTDD